MNRFKHLGLTRIGMLAALTCAGPAIGQDLTATPAAGDVSIAQPSTAAAAQAPASMTAAPLVVRRTPFGSPPLAPAALGAKRGGDRVLNDNKLKGVVADNKASNLTTGMNVISDGAFAGSSGMPTVIQNSGNNVLIQNSTIVNVQVK